MDFELSPVAKGYQERLLEFMDEWVYPNEAAAEEQIAASGDPHHHPEILETLKAEARRRELLEPFLAAQDEVDVRVVESRLRPSG